MTDVVQALALLTPYDININKVRIGPARDGGYILADDFSTEQVVLSYGIQTEYEFDAEMARRGHDVYMFDHTIDGIEATSHRMHFFRQGVAGISDPENLLYSISDHLVQHDISSSRLILKMDVEGCEFAALLALKEMELLRFDQIVFEVHGLNRLEDEGYRRSFSDLFIKMNRFFTLFHVHANNYDGPNGFDFVSGLPVSNLLELSYIRSDRVKRSPSRTLYPTYQDFPNVHALDKRLWIFPFLPTPLAAAEFAASWERTHLLAKCLSP